LGVFAKGYAQWCFFILSFYFPFCLETKRKKPACLSRASALAGRKFKAVIKFRKILRNPLPQLKRTLRLRRIKQLFSFRLALLA
jgi:hypothetical protein